MYWRPWIHCFFISLITIHISLLYSFIQNNRTQATLKTNNTGSQSSNINTHWVEYWQQWGEKLKIVKHEVKARPPQGKWVGISKWLEGHRIILVKEEGRHLILSIWNRMWKQRWKKRLLEVFHTQERTQVLGNAKFSIGKELLFF